MPVWKVVEVLQDFLPEYVDKKFTRDYYVILYLSIFNSFRVIRCLSQCLSPKISIFTTFLFPLGTRPCGNHAKRCTNKKTIQCLPNPSQHVPTFNCFRVKGCLIQCVSPNISIFTTFFPEDAPGAITLNVVWMEREFDAYKLSCCMCPSNYNCFWDRARYWSNIVIFFIPPCIRRPR